MFNKITGNVQGTERKLQQILFKNLNPFKLTDFVILALWTSKDQTSLDFLSRSHLIVYKHDSSSFTHKNPTSAISTSLRNLSQKLDMD
jgi:hypothetical protein